MEQKTKCKSHEMKICGNVTVWPKWQIVIPKDVRDQIWIKTWDNLVVLVKWGVAIWLIKNENMQEIMEYIKSEIDS